jgi:hypothetical protein
MSPQDSSECQYALVSPGPPAELRCARCGHKRLLRNGLRIRQLHRTCPRADIRFALPAKPSHAPAVQFKPPQDGPGSELKAVFASLDIEKLEGCQCEPKMAQMNAWGVDGCREHFDEIVGWLREGAKQFDRRTKFKAARKAVTTGLAKEINWLDPFPGIVELAIKRAAEKQAAA